MAEKEKTAAAGLLGAGAGLGAGIAIGRGTRPARATPPEEINGRIDAILEDIGELKRGFSTLANALENLITVLTPRVPVFGPGLAPYNVRKFELDTAKPTTDPQQVDLPGDALTFYTNGTYEDIYVALDSPTNDWVPIAEFGNPLPYPGRFDKFYLSWTAQSGKYLRVFVGREAGAQAQVQITAAAPKQVFYIAESDKDTHFTGALTQYAKEDENITGLLAEKVRITGIGILSDQQLHYKVLFWYKDTFDDSDLDVDEYCGEVDLDIPTYGFQIDGSGKWYLDIRNLHLDYHDLDATKELHISLMNMSTTSKNAGATGEVKLFVTYEPRA